MQIDAHQHFWAPSRGDYGWMASAEALAPLRRPIGPADFEPFRAAHDIDKTVLVQAAPTTAETHYMLGLADATPWIAKVVGWVDFDDPSDRPTLERFARHPKFSGVRPMIQDIDDRAWMLRPEIAWGFDAVQELDLTFDALLLPRHLENFLLLMERYPDMRVAVDHCAKPQIRDRAFAAWAKRIERVAGETKAVCKLSGLATEALDGWTIEDLRPYVDHVLAVFGPERVMWGSDWPVLTLAADYEDWRDVAEALVPERDHAAVFGETAARFYRIE